MMRFVFALLLCLSPMAAHAQEGRVTAESLPVSVSRLADWMEGLMAAQAPADGAIQTMRRVVGALQTTADPNQRGALLIAMGPDVADGLGQIRQAQGAVSAYPAPSTGDAEYDAMGAAAHEVVRASLSDYESALLGLQEMHEAAVRRDVAAVRRAAANLLRFPPLWLRSSAASFRLVAFQSIRDPASYHFYEARAYFYDAGAAAIDLAAPIDRAAINAHLDDAARAISAGRLSLAADRVLATSAEISPELRTGLTELIQLQEQSFSVVESASASLRTSVAGLGDSAGPEERLRAVREAGLIERESNALAQRMSALALQIVR